MPCPQPLLIHSDGSATCAVPGCLDRLSVEEAVRRHRHVVNCRSVVGTRCPVCHRAGSDGAEENPAIETDRECPGIVIVHVDLSAECSMPDCVTRPSRGAWLARHTEVRSCRDLTASCALCAVSR